MMPTIRIDDDVLDGLKSMAEPFSDTPNSVIRRLLEEHGHLAKPTSRSRKDKVVKDEAIGNSEISNQRKQALTAQPIYETFLLYVLWKLFDGKASKNEVTDAVITSMKSKGFISDADLETVSTGETKAKNTIAWGRNALKDMGLISSQSAKGVWELTSEGVEKAKQIVLPIPIDSDALLDELMGKK